MLTWLRSPASPIPSRSSYDSALRSGPLWTGSQQRLTKRSRDNASRSFPTSWRSRGSLRKRYVLLVPLGFVPFGSPLVLAVHSGPLTTIESYSALVGMAPSAGGSLVGLPPQLTPPPSAPLRPRYLASSIPRSGHRGNVDAPRAHFRSEDLGGLPQIPT